MGAYANVKGREPCQFWSFFLSRGMLFLAADRNDVLAGLDKYGQFVLEVANTI